MIETAKDLVGVRGGKPRQSNLRRAVSTAYYALFHCLARAGADLMVGGNGATRSRHAWHQVYRALEPNIANKNCERTATIQQFPQGNQDFAYAFVTMERKRHLADYDPGERFSKSLVVRDISLCAHAIESFRAAPQKDRRAFAAYVLFRKRS